MDIVVRKNNFVRILKERLFLRFHMSLILIGTALTGLLASKILLIAHVDNIVIRYPIAVVVSYLVFFGFIKLWLSYVTSGNYQEIRLMLTRGHRIEEHNRHLRPSDTASCNGKGNVAKWNVSVFSFFPIPQNYPATFAQKT